MSSKFTDQALVFLQFTVTVTCTAPFLQSPKLQLGYNHVGEVCNQNLPLPITTTKFVTPPDAAIPREAFFNRWRALAGAKLLNAAFPAIALQIYSVSHILHKLSFTCISLPW